jgi:hypothetical protein
MSRNPGKNRKSNENRDEILVDIQYAAITSTDTLENYFSVTFAANVTSIWLIPEDATDDIRMSFSGNASGSTAQIPRTGVAIAVDQTVAAAMEVFSAGANLTLMIYGPRT